jgi:hypothetical protein
MRKTTLFAVFILTAIALVGSPSGLSWSCGDSTGSGCAPGPVTFTGQNYPSTVHVHVVRNSNNEVYDDWDYDASNGTLNFTETLQPADSYTVTISGDGVSSTQTVSTGVSQSSRDND